MSRIIFDYSGLPLRKAIGFESGYKFDSDSVGPFSDSSVDATGSEVEHPSESTEEWLDQNKKDKGRC